MSGGFVVVSALNGGDDSGETRDEKGGRGVRKKHQSTMLIERGVGVGEGWLGNIKSNGGERALDFQTADPWGVGVLLEENGELLLAFITETDVWGGALVGSFRFTINESVDRYADVTVFAGRWQRAGDGLRIGGFHVELITGGDEGVEPPGGQR
jgi:hypothetical protein